MTWRWWFCVAPVAFIAGFLSMVAAGRLWRRRLTEHELSYLFSRRNLADLIAEWYGRDFNSLRCKVRCECKGLHYKVRFTYDSGLSGPCPYEAHGESLFRKVAEYRAVADAIMEEAGRYHWEETAK